MKVWKFYKGLSEEEVRDKCRQIFVENYVRDKSGERMIVRTRDGFQVFFHEYQFWHAFSYENKQLGIRRFSYQRARRVLWIKRAIEGHSGFKRKDEGGRRLYFYERGRYVVVLKRTKRGFRFATHYVLRSKRKFLEMCSRFQ